MATKKKETKKKPAVNVDLLFEKVSKLGQELERLEVDVKDMAVELIKGSKEYEERKSLFDRIRARMGL